MNRTIEQWQKVSETRFHGRVLDQAIEDMQELAQLLETERAAWSAKRAELLRNHAAELARRKVAEAQRDELVHMLDGIDDAEMLDVLGCDNFNRYMDISKGNV